MGIDSHNLQTPEGTSTNLPSMPATNLLTVSEASTDATDRTYEANAPTPARKNVAKSTLIDKIDEIVNNAGPSTKTYGRRYTKRTRAQVYNEADDTASPVD